MTQLVVTKDSVGGGFSQNVKKVHPFHSILTYLKSSSNSYLLFPLSNKHPLFTEKFEICSYSLLSPPFSLMKDH